MREVLYKAKTQLIVGTWNYGKEDGEWVKGYIRQDCGKWIIYQFELGIANQLDYEIDPDTICQYTGALDKYKKEIWENSLVKDSTGNIYKVYWNESKCSYFCICLQSTTCWMLNSEWSLSSLNENNNLELIGNVFDNPELVRKTS